MNFCNVGYMEKKNYSSSKLINKPLPEDDPIQRKPHIQLATQKLQWEPTITFEEGSKNNYLF